MSYCPDGGGGVDTQPPDHDYLLLLLMLIVIVILLTAFMVSKSGSMQHYLTWFTLYRLRHCLKPGPLDQKTKKLCAIVHEFPIVC